MRADGVEEKAAVGKSGRVAELPPSDLKIKRSACKSDPPPRHPGLAQPGGLRRAAPAPEASPEPLPPAPARLAGLRRQPRSEQGAERFILGEGMSFRY